MIFNKSDIVSILQKLFAVIGLPLREGRSLTGKSWKHNPQVKGSFYFELLRNTKHLKSIFLNLKLCSYSSLTDEEVVMGNKLLVYIR